jgi:hypothetical protein
MTKMTAAHLEAVNNARFVTVAALAALAENPKATKTQERSTGVARLLAEVAAHLAAQIRENDDAG